ncbi:VWA domain-containing protein [Actinoplanes sp. NPDC000266]
MMQFTRRVAAVSAVALALVVPLSAPAMADDSREDVFRRLQVDQVPADYVILVDTSGSMDDLFGGVRSTLGTFLSGLSPTDHVALFTFDSGAVPRYIGPAGNTARMMADLPVVPDGSSTDIGRAIEQAVSELERPGAAAVASVVLISDGGHYPGAGTDYPKSTGTAWDALKARAGKLKTTSVKGYALPLSGESGAPLLGSVIRDTTVLDPKAVTQLGEYLDRSKEGARLEKARVMLAPDQGKGVTATWEAPATADLTGRDVPVTLTLQSDTTHTPVTVTGLKAGMAGGPDIAGEIPEQIDLAPGESRTFPLTLTWDREPWPIPFHDERTSTGPLSLTGQVTVPWAAALKPDIDLKTPAGPAGNPPGLTVSSTVGTWTAQAVAAAVALVMALLIALILYLRKRAPQSGTLVAISPMTGQEVARFPLRGRVTRIGGQGLTGEGTVVARRVPRQAANTDGVEYEIRFRGLDRTDTTTLPSRGSVLVGGVAFEHQPPPEPIPAGRR